MNYLDYSPLIDTGLMVALALIVWAAYRELSNRKRDDQRPSHMSGSSAI